jgi:nucleotide-binding universal stress UspA family protein
MTLAWVVMVLLALINIVGIRESATIALCMAVLALVVDVGVVAVVVARVGLPEWTIMGDLLASSAGADLRTLLIGFSGAWLAFSGLESISQVTPAMRLPLRATARRGMFLVVASIVVLAPLLTLFSVALLSPETKAGHHERFISELAGLWGGLPLRTAVVVSASALLLFAANTAIIGTYHVFVSLADKGFMPSLVAVRNARFGTPHVAILTATCIPLMIVAATGADLVALGDLYAFGLLGAFLLTSLGIDVIRARERVAGPRFWIGVATTLAVALAWSVNLVAKQEATLFGVLALGVGLALALATHQRVFSNLFYEQPAVTRVTKRKIAEAERGLEEEERATILSLSQAQALAKLYPSRTLIALRGASPEIVREAIAREKGRGGSALYALYVEERTGLFVRSVEFETTRGNAQAIEALDAAAKQAEQAGMTLLPVWTVSYNAVEGIVRAALALEVDAVLVGVSQRSAIFHLLRGHIVQGLSRRLPAHVHMLLYS